MKSLTRAEEGESDLTPLVSIIILNYNGEKFVEKCLKSVLETSYQNFEIIFVDNGSTDGSLQIANEVLKATNKAKIIENHGNVGFAAGNNIGAKKARGKYLIFLNNDTEVERDWISEAIRVFEADPSIGAGQSKLLMMDRKTLDSVGYYIDPLVVPIPISKAGEVDHGQYDQVNEIFYPKGAALIIRRELFELVEGFEDYYFIYFEDMDLGWKTWLTGNRVVLVPSSVVYHAAGAITGTLYRPNLYFHYKKNHLVTLIENFEAWNVLKYLPIVILWDMRNILVIGLAKMSGRKTDELVPWKSIMKAYMWLLANSMMILRRRGFVQTKVRKTRDETLLGKSVKKFYSYPRLLILGPSRALLE